MVLGRSYTYTNCIRSENNFSIECVFGGGGGGRRIRSGSEFLTTVKFFNYVFSINYMLKELLEGV